MGLDICVFKKLRKTENYELDEDMCPIDCDNQWRPGDVIDYTEEIWSGRTEGLKKDTVYEFEDTFVFRAGSYFSYNMWRSMLEDFKGDVAFQELIDFSDCEGVIGAVVSKKLYNDFKTYEKEAEEYAKKNDYEYFYDKYLLWMKAFEMASDDGAVEFC